MKRDLHLAIILRNAAKHEAGPCRCEPAARTCLDRHACARTLVVPAGNPRDPRSKAIDASIVLRVANRCALFIPIDAPLDPRLTNLECF